ncbi:hypothetical protein [Pseudonocardia cypriaca]|uniref:Uncharacterized protein n=1 Tax=Pseudonocardia cypriaca TaxID=882449 RepID=A0A543GCY8_9PSEU|nr:hypothetical protein [Pseudonocardia cypriaca]TQM43904.1 hypothetical protein FB388_1259 [Pseudonocardia cypriaca]
MNTPADPEQSCGDQGSLFVIPSPDPTGSDRESPSDAIVLKRLRSFVASIANDASAVTDDPRALQLARDLSEVFADHAGLTGLTKAEAEQALAKYGHYDEAFFESRFELFIRMELISPFLAKKHQQRYVLDPSGLAGLLVFERLGTRGGVDEMLLLLDRTRWMLERGDIDRVDLVRYLKRCRQLLSVYAAKLARLVDTASIAVLIEEHRNHDAARVQQDVHSMNKLVSDRFPGDHELGDLAFRLVEAELRYREQVIAAVSRVLDQGGATLDFSVLPAEQYRTAAQDCTLDELAGVGASLVVDPPQPWIDPGALLDAIEEYRPRVRVSGRPPAPTVKAEDDPIGAMRTRYERKAYERARQMEDYLQGAQAVELTLTLRALGWPQAGEQLMELLAVSADPDQPFSVELGQMLLVDREGAVTYMHPVFLKRPQEQGLLAAEEASWSDDEQEAAR